ncbi:MAG: hypothetical protein Q9227_003704 [Pyrenula ochraceoflavens]
MAAQTTPPASPADIAQKNPQTPAANDPRFLMELEFVTALSNPSYLSNLAITQPHLLTRKPDVTTSNRGILGQSEDTDADCFARYLAYLYSYWRTPEYSRYLTHPGQTLRALELLQQEDFRRDIIKPAVIDAFARGETLHVAANGGDNSKLEVNGKGESNGVSNTPDGA